MAKTVEQIKKEMEANSKAWHTADAETKKKLAAANQELGKQIGGVYDGATGTWDFSSSGSSNSPTSTPTTTPTPTTSNSKNSQYTSLGTHYDAGLSSDEKATIDIYGNIYNDAMARGDTATAEAAHAAAEAIRAKYGYSGGADGSDYIALEQENPTTNININDILNWNNNYNQSNPQPTYESKYDPRIDELLNEILTREDFSYIAENDPLYAQYKAMYNREGDRAMKETMANAAASAGGMNTYAMTAAMQEANRYASQLNDRIPELYQLAYEMYLADKESKVQDLGIISDMDDKQYSRYRDTMSDWRNDKNFAYGTFQDAVQQGNWQQTFDREGAIDTRDFLYQDYWNNKEWNTNNSRYDQETAKDEVWRLIELGVTPNADLIAKAGMSQADVNLAVAAVKAGIDNTNKREDYDADLDVEEEEEVIEPINDSILSGVTNLGLGPISDAAVLELVESGAVILNANGFVKWADGWNSVNYRDALEKGYKDRLFPTLKF